MSENNENESNRSSTGDVINALGNLDLNAVQSVASGGVQITFKNNRGADEKAAVEAELLRRRAGYDPRRAFFSTKWSRQ